MSLHEMAFMKMSQSRKMTLIVCLWFVPMTIKCSNLWLEAKKTHSGLGTSQDDDQISCSGWILTSVWRLTGRPNWAIIEKSYCQILLQK